MKRFVILFVMCVFCLFVFNGDLAAKSKKKKLADKVDGIQWATDGNKEALKALRERLNALESKAGDTDISLVSNKKNLKKVKEEQIRVVNGHGGAIRRNRTHVNRLEKRINAIVATRKYSKGKVMVRTGIQPEGFDPTIQELRSQKMIKQWMDITESKFEYLDSDMNFWRSAGTDEELGSFVYLWDETKMKLGDKVIVSKYGKITHDGNGRVLRPRGNELVLAPSQGYAPTNFKLGFLPHKGKITKDSIKRLGLTEYRLNDDKAMFVSGRVVDNKVEWNFRVVKAGTWMAAKDGSVYEYIKERGNLAFDFSDGLKVAESYYANTSSVTKLTGLVTELTTSVTTFKESVDDFKKETEKKFKALNSGASGRDKKISDMETRLTALEKNGGLSIGTIILILGLVIAAVLVLFNYKIGRGKKTTP